MQRQCLVAEIDTSRMAKCRDGLKLISLLEQGQDLGDLVYPFGNDIEQVYNLTADPTEQINIVNNSDTKASEAYARVLATVQAFDAEMAPLQCDACGSSATYYETVHDQGGVMKRTVTSTGCPNHYSLCTGKARQEGCGGRGVEGNASQATEQGVYFEIPAVPLIARNVTDISCVGGAIAVALNGVAIYGK